MSHPEELLTEYVDGALAPTDRVLVDAHLTSCTKCSEEVALAQAARPVLVSLPEEPAPAGVTRRAIEEAEAGHRTPQVTFLAQRRYRILAVAAAAAVVALIAVSLPKLGSTRADSRAATAADASQGENGKAGSPAFAPPTGLPPLEVQRTNYDSATTADLSVTPIMGPVSGGATGAPYGVVETASPQEAQAALTCLQTAFGPGFAGDPVRLIRASFQGQAAFIGIYAEGPGAGLPPDTASVRVASVKGCTLLTFTSRQI